MELTGTFFHYDEMNRNGRIYSEEVVDDMVVQFGNLDHPMYGELNPGYDNEIYMGMQNPSHEVCDLHINRETKTLEGTIKLLDTHSGKIAQELLNAEMPLSVASRGIGSVDSSGYVTLQKIITYDLVHEGAFDSNLKLTPTMVDATMGGSLAFNGVVEDMTELLRLQKWNSSELYEGVMYYVKGENKHYVFIDKEWKVIHNNEQIESPNIRLDDL